MLELLRRWLADATPEPTPKPEPPGRIDGSKLIHRVDLTVDASCPCGSQIIHHLTLMTTAECPRIVHPLSPNTVGVPVPPYSGSSLDHRTCHTYPSGGARSGSGNDPAMRSGPRLIHNSRSSADRSKK